VLFVVKSDTAKELVRYGPGKNLAGRFRLTKLETERLHYKQEAGGTNRGPFNSEHSMAWGILLLCTVLGALAAYRPSKRKKDFVRPADA